MGSGIVRAFVIGCLVCVAPVAGAGEWAVFRGDARQSGVAASAVPDDAEILWRFDVGAGNADPNAPDPGVEGTAAVAGGIVYVGSLGGNLYALVLADGKEKWRYKTAGVDGPVSFHSGAVYVGDADGVFHCVDAATGKKRWRFETGGDIKGGANFTGDSVLFGAGDETLYCLSLEGKERWRFKVPGGPVMATPAVVGGRTFVAGCDSSLHVIDVANGKEVASVGLDGQTGSTAAVDGDELFVGTMANQLIAVNWRKPAVGWRFEAPRRPQPFFSSAAVSDRLVISGSRDKRVHALDRKSGKEVWSFPTDRKVDSSPVVVGERVWVGSSDGNLYVLDRRKGTEVRRYELGGEILASPAVADGRLVIGTTKGVVYCLGKK